MKRNRTPRNATKLISINSAGKVIEIDRNQCIIPNKNVFVTREKVTHDIQKRKAFQDISNRVAEKVDKIKHTEQELKEYKRIHTRLVMSNLDRIFKSAIDNAPDIPEIVKHQPVQTY